VSLRAIVFERDGGRCIWPSCVEPALELAHFHSLGSGGSNERDVASNSGAMCRPHARASDGEYGPGGKDDYRRDHINLFGPGYQDIPPHRLAWERAEALTELVRNRT